MHHKFFRLIFFAAIGAGLLFSACSDDDSENKPPAGGDGEEQFIPPNEPDNRAVFEIWGPTEKRRAEPHNRLPFPYNFFTEEDPNAATGIRPNLLGKPDDSVQVINTNLLDYGLFFLNDNYYQSINTLDGFSAFGMIFFEVYPDVDPLTLPQTPEESVADDSSIRLLNIDEDSPDFGGRTPVWVERKEAYEMNAGEKTHQFWYVAIKAVRPLVERTHYAVVVRRGLKTPDGDHLEPSVHFQIVSGMIPENPSSRSAALLSAERERFAPVMDLLAQDAIGLTKDDLVLAFDFSTQTVTHDVITARDWCLNGEFGEAPAPDFDVTDDGEPDLFDSAETYHETYPTPSCRCCQSFGMNMTHIGAILHGTFKARNFRLPRVLEENTFLSASFDHDENGDPVPQEEMDVPFLLFLPKITSENRQPFPVVLLQHGINACKEAVVSLAPEFAERGWASLSTDFPYHGERSNGNLPALQYIDIIYPLKARAAFMQSTIDQIQLLRMLRSYNLDVYPEGGDGHIDLSNDKIAYLGQSLGGISGGVTAGASKFLGASILNVGGGGLIDFVEDFLEQYNIAFLFPEHYMQQFSTVAQTILDGGDSVNYAKFIIDPPGDYVPKNILMQESIDDETVPNQVTENLARALNTPHLAPVERGVYGLEAAAPPVEGLGFTQFAPANHNTLFESLSKESTRRMREQVWWFFQSFFESESGVAEIIVPQKNQDQGRRRKADR